MPDLVDRLPTELNIDIAERLPTPDLLRLAMASKKHWSFFKGMISVRKILHHVMHGEHLAVEEMLKADIKLLFKRGKITDCSGRTFEYISCFEYALWALDMHMWSLMLRCIPENDEGNMVLKELSELYKKIEKDGVIYRLNDKQIKEKHFDFENTIIKQMQILVDMMNELDTKDWEKINNQWKKGIGGAQKLLPMHVVYEYCSNTPFHPLPQFINKPQPSKTFFRSKTKDYESWFAADSKLSIDFSLCKANSDKSIDKDKVHGMLVVTIKGSIKYDLADKLALEKLFKIRKNDFRALKSILAKRIEKSTAPSAAFI